MPTRRKFMFKSPLVQFVEAALDRPLEEARRKDISGSQEGGIGHGVFNCQGGILQEVLIDGNSVLEYVEEVHVFVHAGCETMVLNLSFAM